MPRLLLSRSQSTHEATVTVGSRIVLTGCERMMLVAVVASHCMLDCLVGSEVNRMRRACFPRQSAKYRK